MSPAILGAWVLAGAASGAATTWLARRYALRRRLIDLPGERRSHQCATPRGGGISIVVVLLLACGALALASPGQASPIALAAAGLLLVAGIGWIDDHRPLSPWLRLGVHALAGGLLATALHAAGGSWLDASVAFAAALVLTNVWNFMDGIDGIAAGQALVVATGYAVFAEEGPVLWLGVALAAGAAGFLPFNFPRARIFLGDVGSGALGYAIAALLALSGLRGDVEARLLLVFPLLPFLLDASFTLLLRIVRGEAWWRPHVQHAYQVWARRRGSHVGVTVAYALAALATTTIMFSIQSWGSGRIMMAHMMFLLVGGVAWKRLQELQARDGPDSFGQGNP